MWNATSTGRLNGVDPRLVSILERARESSGINFEISEGMRDQARQDQMVAQGKSQTRNGRHLTGNATDIHILNDDGSVNWDFEAYRPIADAAKLAATEMGYDDFQWGGDWNTLKDGVHFQVGGNHTNPTVSGGAGQGALSGGQGNDMLGNGGRPRLDITPSTIGEGLKDGSLSMPDDLMGRMFPDESKGEIGWFKNLNPNLSSQGVDNRLLAIGAGLLSGNDWQEGFAASAQNLSGVVNGEQSDRKTEDATNAEWDWKADQDKRDKDWRSKEGALTRASAEKRAAEVGNRKKHLGNVKMADGEFRADISVDQNGQFWDSAGNEVDGSTIDAQVTRSLSGGDKGQMSMNDAFKREDSILGNRGTLESLDKVSLGLQDASYGAEGVIADLTVFGKTLMSRGLTEEEMNRPLTQARIQGLIGKTKDDVVGPGVMTEADAGRVISALGGDLRSILANPELGVELLADMHRKTKRKYDFERGQWDTMRESYPNIPYSDLGARYESPAWRNGGAKNGPGALDGDTLSGGGGSIDDILNGYNIN